MRECHSNAGSGRTVGPSGKSPKPARRRSEIPPNVLAELNAGTRETGNLVEGLAVDFQQLAAAAFPELPAGRRRAIDPALGVKRRMEVAAEQLREHFGPEAIVRCRDHASDTVRGWACFLIGAAPGVSLAARLKRLRPLAEDPHFGVREWAWMAIRRDVVDDPCGAIELLTPWTRRRKAEGRRFAVEATRPRGVWSAHIDLLKRSPEFGLPLLEPLRRDPAKYVQDSVANWLNDAAKTRPDWVRGLVDAWRSEDTNPNLERVCRRATRNL